MEIGNIFKSHVFTSAYYPLDDNDALDTLGLSDINIKLVNVLEIDTTDAKVIAMIIKRDKYENILDYNKKLVKSNIDHEKSEIIAHNRALQKHKRRRRAS